MSPVSVSVRNALELVHDGWFLFICLCIVCGFLSVLAVKTRENGQWEALVVSRAFLFLFAAFWMIVCIQGWNDIRNASAVNAMFWLSPFAPILVALLIAGATFFIRPSTDEDDEST